MHNLGLSISATSLRVNKLVGFVGLKFVYLLLLMQQLIVICQKIVNKLDGIINTNIFFYKRL
jgi:hypothetical protein